MTAFRNAALKKVQIARRELRLEDDDYRGLLERVTGRRSTTELDERQLGHVLDELKARGWTPRIVSGARTAGPSRQRVQPADHPSARKARALWLSLWNLGEVRDPSEAALEAFARRQLKVERLQWADQPQTYKLIEALKAMAERAGWLQATFGAAPAPTIQLKRQLILAQHRRLGLADPIQNPRDFHEPDLDRIIATLGREIRALPEAAG